MDNKPKKDRTLSFRIDEDLNEKIEKLASKANRSKSNFVINLLKKSIKDIEDRDSFMNN